eukprot:TRINITY_DN5613_c0_g1_i1.p1 TRINITY_DN5613_c0_g1~~TRINITY_DN5613_c0_g1_i1.p1  ORF type:complete len:898 (-),score=164.63 TRINITY_DN5613_c0_g1_i1:31-2430(-)
MPTRPFTEEDAEEVGRGAQVDDNDMREASYGWRGHHLAVDLEEKTLAYEGGNAGSAANASSQEKSSFLDEEVSTNSLNDGRLRERISFVDSAKVTCIMRLSVTMWVAVALCRTVGTWSACIHVLHKEKMISDAPPIPLPSPVRAMVKAFQKVWVCCGLPTIYMYDKCNPVYAVQVEGHTGSVTCLAKLSKCVLSYADDFTLRLWDEQGLCISVIPVTFAVTSFSVAIPCSGGGSATCWIGTTQGVFMLDSNTRTVESAAFYQAEVDCLAVVPGLWSPSPREHVWSAHSNGSVLCWDTLLKKVIAAADSLRLSAMRCIGPRMWCCTCNSKIQIWDCKSFACLEEIQHPNGTAILCVVPQHTRGNTMMWSGTCKGDVEIWDSDGTSHDVGMVFGTSHTVCSACNKKLSAGKTALKCKGCSEVVLHVQCCAKFPFVPYVCFPHASAAPFFPAASGTADAEEGVQHPAEGAEQVPADAVCAENFNQSPTKAVQMLLTTRGLRKERGGEVVARFLRTNSQILHPRTVGDFIGSGDQAEVLTSFVRLLEFGPRDLEMSLRMFLRSLSLPGEAQKIDRLLTAFAKRYVESAQKQVEDRIEGGGAVSGEDPLFTLSLGHAGSDPESIYALCFSCTMLNTALHNMQASAGCKMDLERWIHSNTGLAGKDKGDFPRDLLEHLYYQINDCPFEFFSVEEAPVMQGMLNKKGARGWRWCVLWWNSFAEYRRNQQQHPLRLYDTRDIKLVAAAGPATFAVHMHCRGTAPGTLANYTARCAASCRAWCGALSKVACALQPPLPLEQDVVDDAV